MFEVMYELDDGNTQETFGPFETFKEALEALENVFIILQSEMKEINWIQIGKVQ